MQSKAYLFGLNYDGTPASLRGCHNDVIGMSNLLNNSYGIPCEVYVDGSDASTSAGFVAKLADIAKDTIVDNLDLVVIHFSGHGESVVDTNNDESDGMDESLVPSDFDKGGSLITDDTLNEFLKTVNPKTRVTCVFDACHSGTMLDLTYKWSIHAGGECRCEHDASRATIKARVLSLSGSRDNQTSADAYNIYNDHKFSGALTSCLMHVLTKTPSLANDVVGLYEAVQKELKAKQFSQQPVLCASFNISPTSKTPFF
jgi:hypothetical protein